MATNLSLADAQATPVTHTYIPIGRDKNGVFWFEDQSSTNSIGNWRIAVELKRPQVPQGRQTSEGRTYRARIEFHMPILENVTNSTVSGVAPAPTVSYVCRSFAEFVIPERASLLDRKNLSKMLRLAIADAQIVPVLENLVYLY